MLVVTPFINFLMIRNMKKRTKKTLCPFVNFIGALLRALDRKLIDT